MKDTQSDVDRRRMLKEEVRYLGSKRFNCIGEATSTINPLTGEEYLPESRKTNVAGEEYLTFQLALCEMEGRGQSPSQKGDTYDYQIQSNLIKDLHILSRGETISASDITHADDLDRILTRLNLKPLFPFSLLEEEASKLLHYELSQSLSSEFIKKRLDRLEYNSKTWEPFQSDIEE